MKTNILVKKNIKSLFSQLHKEIWYFTQVLPATYLNEVFISAESSQQKANEKTNSLDTFDETNSNFINI